MSKPKPKKVSRLGLDDRSFGERAAGLVNRAHSTPKKAGAPRRSGFGQPAEMSEAQKQRLRKLRKQAKGQK